MYGLRRDVNICINNNNAYIQVRGNHVPIRWDFAFLLAFMDGSNSIEKVISDVCELGLVSEEGKEGLICMFKKKFDVFLEEYPANFKRNDLLAPTRMLELEHREIAINEFPLPTSVYYNITDSCDKNCSYCFMKEKKRCVESDILIWKEIKKILDEMHAYGIGELVITGGEPFLHKDIINILSYANELGIWTSVTTKHYFSKKEAEALGKLKRVNIKLSFDCHIPEIAEALIYSKDHIQKMETSIRFLQDCNVDLEIHPIITKINIDYTMDFLKYLKKFEIRKVVFHLYEPIGEEIDSELMFTDEQKQIFDTVLNEKNIIPQISIYPAFYEKLCMVDVSHDFGCRNGIVTLCLRPNGDVIICPFMDEKKQPCFGNLRTESLVNIWNHPERRVLSNPPDYVFEGTICKDCEKFCICVLKNVCHRQSIEENGNLLSVSSWTRNMCSLYHIVQEKQDE